MVEDLTERMHRDWNMNNDETSDYNQRSALSRLLSRKVSDKNNNQHYSSNNDFDDPPSFSVRRTIKPHESRTSLDASYDTDGALGTNGRRSKQHRHTTDNYEHLVTPRLSTRRSEDQSSKLTKTVPTQERLSLRTRTTANTPSGFSQNQDDREEDTLYPDGDANHRPVRRSRRVRQGVPTNGNNAAHPVPPTGLVQHSRALAPTPSVQPLRIIFMRHGERANQALGPDWFFKAFRTNTYRAYDQNLPFILPKRRFDQAYEFDAPLTVRGLKTARLTGRSMMANNMHVDICLSSTALRCVQTCERILTGMDRRDRVPIRIEPGLYECPHHNHKLVDSFMSKKELMDNRYNIKQEYKPIISKVLVPETLEEYFERSAMVMRGIIDRYGPYGGTLLIVSHAPGLLALSDAMKGLRPNAETFYRSVSAFPPLTMYIAEYDGSKWKYSDQHFNLVLPTA